MDTVREILNTITEWFDSMSDFSTASVIFRLCLATICGGLIGIDRGRKRRPAGFRTYMLVCIGASLTMLISQYTRDVLGITTDVTRLGAQVINGIGFLGAGTIIVTRRQQVKGLTTAAGLWASACMGIAIGAGYYVAAVSACLLIMLVLIVLSKLEVRIMASARTMTVSVGYDTNDDIVQIIDTLKAKKVHVVDLEIVKMASGESTPSAVLSLRLPKRFKHTELLESLAGIDGVNQVEEI